MNVHRDFYTDTTLRTSLKKRVFKRCFAKFSVIFYICLFSVCVNACKSEEEINRERNSTLCYDNRYSKNVEACRKICNDDPKHYSYVYDIACDNVCYNALGCHEVTCDEDKNICVKGCNNCRDSSDCNSVCNIACKDFGDPNSCVKICGFKKDPDAWQKKIKCKELCKDLNACQVACNNGSDIACEILATNIATNKRIAEEKKNCHITAWRMTEESQGKYNLNVSWQSTPISLYGIRDCYSFMLSLDSLQSKAEFMGEVDQNIGIALYRCAKSNNNTKLMEVAKQCDGKWF